MVNQTTGAVLFSVDDHDFPASLDLVTPRASVTRPTLIHVVSLKSFHVFFSFAEFPFGHFSCHKMFEFPSFYHKVKRLLGVYVFYL